jgi:hypothetical protein
MNIQCVWKKKQKQKGKRSRLKKGNNNRKLETIRHTTAMRAGRKEN